MLAGAAETGIPAALQRLAALEREGGLDDVNFEVAKRAIIDGEF